MHLLTCDWSVCTSVWSKSITDWLGCMEQVYYWLTGVCMEQVYYWLTGVYGASLLLTDWGVYGASLLLTDWGVWGKYSTGLGHQQPPLIVLVSDLFPHLRQELCLHSQRPTHLGILHTSIHYHLPAGGREGVRGSIGHWLIGVGEEGVLLWGQVCCGGYMYVLAWYITMKNDDG